MALTLPGLSFACFELVQNALADRTSTTALDQNSAYFEQLFTGI
jgi:hypothetical protein